MVCESCGADITTTQKPKKVIQLTMQKINGRKFGLSIASLPDGHYVEKVQESGLAAETGKVSVGMKLIAINGSDTNSLSKQDCIMLFRDAKDHVTLDLIDAERPMQFDSPLNPAASPPAGGSSRMRERATTTEEAELAPSSPLFPEAGGSESSDSEVSAGESHTSVAFPGRKMSTPETFAAIEHVENLTRMLDSLRSFGGVAEEGIGAATPGADDNDRDPIVSPPPTPSQRREVVESFIENLVQRAREGPVDGHLVYGIFLEHFGGDDSDGSVSWLSSGGSETPSSPNVVPGAKSVIARERDRLQRRVWRLESESRAIAKRLLDQQTTFAQQLNELESENESLRAYVDKLMCQLLTARMEQQAAAEEPLKRGGRSPRVQRPVSAHE